MKEKRFQQNRKLWYKCLKKCMHGRYKEPEFIFLGDKPNDGSIILSNHEGTDAPMSLEIYCDFPIRMWGTVEMNSGLIRMYKYQTRVYYHEKKHWNLFLARLFCLIASPLTNLFYKGLKLISTYQDIRVRKTIKESVTAVKENKENIVIFPEKSINGYEQELRGFFSGFVLLAKQLKKEGIDIPIYTAYFKKNELKYIFSKPILYSELEKMFTDRDDMAQYLVNECNKLGK